MPRIGRFEELEAWKKARDMGKAIYRVTSTGSFSRDFSLRDQIRRAGVSAMSNIAALPPDLKALQAAGFPLYTERVDRSNPWAFNDTFKFKIPPLPSPKDAKHPKGYIQVFNAFIIRLLAFLAPWRVRDG